MHHNIVFIDDEQDLCELYVDLFSSPSVKVAAFSDLDLAKKHIESCPTDLIFIDYRMPKVNGNVFRATLDPNIPCILLSGEIFHDAETFSGFKEVLGKPFTEENLEEVIKKYL